jgi:hypothetical protein
VGVIDSYMDTLGGGDVDSPPPPPLTTVAGTKDSSKDLIATLQCKYENSELALYKNTILSETTATTMTATTMLAYQSTDTTINQYRIA